LFAKKEDMFVVDESMLLKVNFTRGSNFI